MQEYIYILSASGKPLMPTRREGHVNYKADTYIRKSYQSLRKAVCIYKMLDIVDPDKALQLIHA